MDFRLGQPGLEFLTHLLCDSGKITCLGVPLLHLKKEDNKTYLSGLLSR